MKTLILFLLSFSYMAAQAAIVPVILMAGQSNMEGRGNVNDLGTPYDGQTTNYIYYNNTLCCTNTAFQALATYKTANSLNAGMEYSLAYTLSQAKGSIYLIKTAQGATSLANSGDWKNGGTLRNQFYSNVNAALSAIVAQGNTPQIIAFVWYQGETDAINNVTTAAYQTALTELINDVRAQSFSSYFITAVLPVQLCRISNNWIDQTPAATPDLIRSAEANVSTAMTSVTLVNTDDATNNGGTDDIHKNMAGQVLIGNRVANNILGSGSGGVVGTKILVIGKKAIVQ